MLKKSRTAKLALLSLFFVLLAPNAFADASAITTALGTTLTDVGSVIAAVLGIIAVIMGFKYLRRAAS